MAPGHEELLSGTPFVGASGRLLNAALFNARISPDSCRIINVINCYPAGKNDKIAPSQFSACAARFEADVQASQAEVVLALGADALLRLTGQKGQITRWRGHVLRPDDLTPIRAARGAIQPAVPPGCRWVVPSLHPSFVIRNGLKPLPFLFEDVKRVRRALDDELNLVQLNGRLDIDAIDESLPLTLDIETDEAGIERIGFAQGGSGTWTWTKQFAPILASPSLKIGHNISFDKLHLDRAGCTVQGPLWDTMWAGQMLQPDLDKNLDTMSSLYLDIPRWKHLSRSQPEYYNEMDVIATQALYHAQVPLLEETGQLELFKREMACLPILIDMTRTGVRVDATARSLLRRDLDARLGAAKTRWNALAPDVNPASPVQLRKLLYFDLGLPAAHKKGQDDPTTEKSALQKLKRKARGRALDILETLLEVRETSKLLAVYFDQSSDRVYPSYFPVGKDDATYGTATGRLSAQNPNIQQVPKALRKMYVPEPGYVMVVADWSQLELRIAAWTAQDEKLMGLFSAGRDPFVEIAKGFPKIDRTRVKNLVYGGGCYGAGWKKLGDTLSARGLDVPAKTIKEFLAWFAREYPGLARRNEQLVRDARRQGYIENAFGRRRAFYDADSHVPEIVNFPIQSAAADMLWILMPGLNKLAYEYGDRPPIAFVHDEVVVQAKPHVAEGCATDLALIMEREFSEIAPGFSVPAKVSIGPNWTDLAGMGVEGFKVKGGWGDTKQHDSQRG